MNKVAAIIKHPYRDGDYRIDMYDIPDEYYDRPDYIKAYIQSNLLGHFKVIALCSRIREDCKFKGSKDDLAKYDKWLKKQNNLPT